MFDIGVNLSSNQFNVDREAVVARARAAGVNGMLLTGTNADESERVAAMARHFPGCWATVGVHPHDASSWSDKTKARILHLLSQERVVAVGECGLDFNRNYSTQNEQEYTFIAQLEIAAERELPVFLHCREAHRRFMTLLKPWIAKVPGAVLHCFTGTRNEALECLDNGLYLGITGWVCDERRGLELQTLLPLIPANRLLLETDAPWLLPRTLQPKPKSRRNEPVYLAHILAQVAQWRTEDPVALERQLDENVRCLFGIPDEAAL